MNAFEAYQTFNALKLHFSQPSYDFHKYNGKIRITEQKFNDRSDKIFYQKLSKHKDAFNYILANVVDTPTIYIKELAFNEQCERVYKDWLRKMESLTYLVGEDLGKIENLRKEIITKGSHPIILQRYLRGELMLETVCILADMIGFDKIWNQSMKDDPIWKKVSIRISKYKPFVKYDKSKIKKIIVDKI